MKPKNHEEPTLGGVILSDLQKAAENFHEGAVQKFEREALENLRDVVRAEIRERDRKTGFFDEAKAWVNLRNALSACC